MQPQHDTTDNFNPAEWLEGWSAAGGGWAGRMLILPPPARPRLREMINELGAGEICAIAEHLGVNVELVE